MGAPVINVLGIALAAAATGGLAGAGLTALGAAGAGAATTGAVAGGVAGALSGTQMEMSKASIRSNEEMGRKAIEDTNASTQALIDEQKRANDIATKQTEALSSQSNPVRTRQRQLARGGTGRANTILTSPLGIPGAASPEGGKTLVGS